MGDRQETADIAALETPEVVASLPAQLNFRAEETERSTRWRPLRPGTLAGLADQSPEGTEERRAPCDAVCTAILQSVRPSKVLGHWHQDILAEDYPVKMTVHLRPGSTTLTAKFWGIRGVTLLK